jgi:hypothetical protein
MKNNRGRFGASDPREKAILQKPPAHFEAVLNIKFDDAHDDLDELKDACFSIDNDLVFKLHQYKRAPDRNATTLEVDRNYSAVEIAKVMKAIQKTFLLAPNDIVMLE